MASPLSRNEPSVGSEEWLENEVRIMTDLVYADVEDLVYETRRDLEWLNEHLTDVIDGNQRYVSTTLLLMDANISSAT